jgi:hypothetical protein
MSGDLLVDTVIDSFPLFLEMHIDLPAGYTDLSSFLAGIPKPVFLMVFSIPEVPFAIDLGAGTPPSTGTTFLTTVKQITPLTVAVDCPAENRLRVVAAGYP